MKRTLAATAAILLALVLTGCGDAGTVDEPVQNLNGFVYIDTIHLPDGREVLCVGWKRMSAGGLSCDWGNAS